MTLTRHKLNRYVDRALTVRLATLSKRGTPLLTPLWFARDGDVIYIGTRGGSPHARNVQAHPRVVMLFGDNGGRSVASVLRITGTARVRDYAEMSVIRKLKMFWRYSMRPEALLRLFRDADKRRVRQRYRQERTNSAMLEITLEAGELIALC